MLKPSARTLWRQRLGVSRCVRRHWTNRRAPTGASSHDDGKYRNSLSWQSDRKPLTYLWRTRRVSPKQFADWWRSTEWDCSHGCCRREETRPENRGNPSIPPSPPPPPHPPHTPPASPLLRCSVKGLCFHVKWKFILPDICSFGIKTIKINNNTVQLWPISLLHLSFVFKVKESMNQ